MKKSYSTEDVQKILKRVKRRIEYDRRLPRSLLKNNCYPEHSPGRERAFGENNVLNMAVLHIERELRELKK